MKSSNLIPFFVATLAAALAPPIPPGQAAAAAVDMGISPRLDTHSLLKARSRVDPKCNSKQKSDIKKALEICRKIAKAAAAAARTGDAARLETYFHTSEPAYRNRIAAVYDEIAQECKDGKEGQLTISCDASASQCPDDPNTVAYYTRGTDTVTLCPAALARPVKPKQCGDRSLAGVLIHEFSHALAANLVVDHRYGRYESTQLARDQGLANADTYQWFAIDVFLNCPAPTAPPTSTTDLPLPSPSMSQGESSAAGSNSEQPDVEHLRDQQWHSFVQEAENTGFTLDTITDYLSQGLGWMQTNIPNLYDMLQRYPAAFNVLLHLGRDGVALSACIRNKRPSRRAKRDPGQSEDKCKPVQAMLGQSHGKGPIESGASKPKPLAPAKFVFYGDFLWPEEAKKQGGFLPPTITPSDTAYEVEGMEPSPVVVDEATEILQTHLQLGPAAQDATRKASKATKGFHGIVYAIHATPNMLLSGKDCIAVGGIIWPQVVGWVQIPLDYTLPEKNPKEREKLQEHFKNAFKDKNDLFQKNPDYDAAKFNDLTTTSKIPDLSTPQALTRFMNENGKQVGWNGGFPLFSPQERISGEVSKANKEANKVQPAHEPTFWEKVGNFFKSHIVAIIALPAVALANLIPGLGEVADAAEIAALSTETVEGIELAEVSSEGASELTPLLGKLKVD